MAASFHCGWHVGFHDACAARGHVDEWMGETARGKKLGASAEVKLCGSEPRRDPLLDDREIGCVLSCAFWIGGGDTVGIPAGGLSNSGCAKPSKGNCSLATRIEFPAIVLSLYLDRLAHFEKARTQADSNAVLKRFFAVVLTFVLIICRKDRRLLVVVSR